MACECPLWEQHVSHEWKVLQLEHRRQRTKPEASRSHAKNNGSIWEHLKVYVPEHMAPWFQGWSTGKDNSILGQLGIWKHKLNRWKDVKGSQLSAVSEYLGETAPTDIWPLPWSRSPALGVPACSGRHGASCLIKWVRKPDTTWSPLLIRVIRKSLLNCCSPCATKCTEPSDLDSLGRCHLHWIPFEAVCQGHGALWAQKAKFRCFACYIG